MAVGLDPVRAHEEPNSWIERQWCQPAPVRALKRKQHHDRLQFLKTAGGVNALSVGHYVAIGAFAVLPWEEKKFQEDEHGRAPEFVRAAAAEGRAEARDAFDPWATVDLGGVEKTARVSEMTSLRGPEEVESATAWPPAAAEAKSAVIVLLSANTLASTMLLSWYFLTMTAADPSAATSSAMLLAFTTVAFFATLRNMPVTACLNFAAVALRFILFDTAVIFNHPTADMQTTASFLMFFTHTAAFYFYAKSTLLDGGAYSTPSTIDTSSPILLATNDFTAPSNNSISVMINDTDIGGVPDDIATLCDGLNTMNVLTCMIAALRDGRGRGRDAVGGWKTGIKGIEMGRDGLEFV
ncbi:hypothetical protein HK101_003344 [Irineochytrium annulatum]|nr:hypothetical protein HK101_003344 [Irineochytrium annulatum]